ncbi:MAG: hypothetical protein R3199_10045 [Gemmatimonadota bacterium]|nr:hypothetical protein [Gemmatimonadota bacterium]
MSRRGWIVLAVVLVVALFALIIGGFLWPRPQFERGPWRDPGPAGGGAPAGAPAEPGR